MAPQHCMTVLLHVSKIFTFSRSKTILDLLVSLLNSKSTLLQWTHRINYIKVSFSHHQSYHPFPTGLKLSACPWDTVDYMSVLFQCCASHPHCTLQVLRFCNFTSCHPEISSVISCSNIRTKTSLCLVFFLLLPHFSALFHNKIFVFLFNFSFSWYYSLLNF